jgi:hypothetical protein
LIVHPPETAATLRTTSLEAPLRDRSLVKTVEVDLSEIRLVVHEERGTTIEAIKRLKHERSYY